MKTMKLTSRSKNSGEGLVVIIVLIVILIGIWWYLQSTKAATQREGIRYGHDVINRLAVNHDRSLLDQDLDPQAKIEMPPSQRDYLIQRFAQFRTASSPPSSTILRSRSPCRSPPHREIRSG
jgi:hypothetical protein